MSNYLEPQTVSELTRNIKLLIQSNFPFVYVVGEISNLSVKQPRNHCYFTLKDEQASISAVIWGSKYMTLDMKPENGMKVLVKGKVVVYEPRGTYQIDVSEISPTGLGELQAAFERLKKKLSEEGLFDVQRKKPLPKYPMKVGIITSPTGAVIKDFKTVAARRFPLAEIFLFPATMQGESSAQSVVKQLHRANHKEYNLDVIVIARGGGSLEDLMPFNDEILAREIAASRLPVVSAIGHETDYTICDFVSDRRAPTPSAAAEIIFPDRNELLETLKRFEYNAKINIRNYIDERKNKLKHIEASYAFRKPIDELEDYKEKTESIKRSIFLNVIRKINYNKESLANIERILQTYNPYRKLVERRKYLSDLSVNISRAALRITGNNKGILDVRYMMLLKFNPIKRILNMKEKLLQNEKEIKAIVTVTLNRKKEDLNNKEKLLFNISPDTTLKRGFIYVKKKGKLVSRKSQLHENDKVVMTFYDGNTNAVIKNKIQPDNLTLFED